MKDQRYSVADFARALDPVTRRVDGMLRRFGIDLTKITKVAGWKLLGFDLDGGQESVTAEVYPGVGLYARPPKGVKADAIVANIQGAEHPTIVATRDEKTRAASAGSIAEDETAVFNSKVILVMKANGTIEARTIGGAAVALATLADVQALRSYIATQLTLPVIGGGTAGPNASPAPPTPTGTTKFKAE